MEMEIYMTRFVTQSKIVSFNWSLENFESLHVAKWPHIVMKCHFEFGYTISGNWIWTNLSFHIVSISLIESIGIELLLNRL